MPTTPIGVAAPGWPTSGAVLDGTRLHVVGRNLDRTRVAVIDIGSWDLVAERIIPAGDGAWAMAKGPDGIYAGLFGARGQGNLYRIAGSAVTAVAALAVDYIWELTALPDGRMLGVASNPSLVFAYDPGTRQATNIGVIGGPQDAPRTCTSTAARLVVGGSTAGKAFLLDRALAGGGVRSILPTALAQDETVYCSTTTPAGRIVVGTAGRLRERPAIAVIDPANPNAALVVRLPREALIDTVNVQGDAVFATARPSGAVYRLDVARSTAERPALFRLTVPVPMAETRDVALVGQRMIGTAADGSVWEHRRDADADPTTVRDAEALGLALRPQRTQSIAAASDRVEVGGSFNLTRHDLADGSSITRFVPGEAKAMVTVGDITYLALYPIGEIWAWEAGAPEPRRITQLDSDQIRPMSLEWVAQLQALVATTTDDRQRLVLHTIDPVTGRVDAVEDPLDGGGLSGLAVSGSTVYVGGSGPAAAVGAIDVTSGRRLWTVPEVLPGGGFVLGLDAIGGRLAVTNVNGWFTTVDLATRAVAPPVRVAASAGRMRRIGGQLLLTTGDALLRLDPVTRTATTLESGLGGAFWGWPTLAGDPQGRTWLIRDRTLVRRVGT